MRPTELSELEVTPPWEWPEEAGEMLLATLADEKADTDDRLLAAQMAGDTAVIDDALASALVSIVRRVDADDELRAHAAIALGPALEDADMQNLVGPEDLGLVGLEQFDLDDMLLSPKILGEIRQTLRTIYYDAGAPQLVRRRALEAAVRGPEDWHTAAVRAAYVSGDPAWRLTAVFCMRFIRGFDAQILEALETEDGELLYEAVAAAGTWAVDDAWDRVSGLIDEPGDDRDVLLAAIEAVAAMRPLEAPDLLAPLADTDDEEILEAIDEALMMAEMESKGFDEDDDDGEPEDLRD